MNGRAALVLLSIGVGCSSRHAGGATQDAGGQTDSNSRDAVEDTVADTRALGPWSGSHIDPSLPPDVAGRFTGPSDGEGRPILVYPLDHSMHPTNLADITFQWSQGKPANALFRIRLENDRGSYDFFAPCDKSECTYQMPSVDWLTVARANPDAVVKVVVAGTSLAGGTGVATSDPVTLTFSPEAVRGGLYYWSTALQGIYRLRFGARKAQPYISGYPTNPKDCGGCHSVSRDGSTIAFTSGLAEGFLVVAPTSDPASRLISAGSFENSSVPALNPTGSLALVSFGSELALFETATGKHLTDVKPLYLGTEMAGYFPEWSPDGSAIVLVLSDKRNGADVGAAKKWHGLDYDLGSGAIAIIPYSASLFGPARVVVPIGADFHFYPSWSPDGRWIAFASAPVGMGGGGSQVTAGDSSYNSPNARLRLVSSDGGAIYDLGRATQGVGKTSTWPKFTPFVQDGGNLMFIGFNSKMDYGFLLPNSKLTDRRPQLWMAAIDLRKVGVEDPSYAPVWLPFQEVTQQNHLAYWTEAVACNPTTVAGSPGGCAEDEECTAGFCQAR